MVSRIQDEDEMQVWAISIVAIHQSKNSMKIQNVLNLFKSTSLDKAVEKAKEVIAEELPDYTINALTHVIIPKELFND